MAARCPLLFLLVLSLALVVGATQAFVVVSPVPRQQRSAALRMMATRPKAANGLTLDQVSSKLKFEVTDLDEGIYGLESKDADYAIEIAKVTVPLKGGLGMGLEELRRGRDGSSLCV